MKTQKQQLGHKGEERAAEYLQKKGMTIIARNFHFGHHELDIIGVDKHTLVVVEVKSVRVRDFGSGEARISKGKQRSIIKATYAFLGRYKKYSGMDVRFDVVCVNFDVYPADIRHYEGAFWDSW